MKLVLFLGCQLQSIQLLFLAWLDGRHGGFCSSGPRSESDIVITFQLGKPKYVVTQSFVFRQPVSTISLKLKLQRYSIALHILFGIELTK